VRILRGSILDVAVESLPITARAIMRGFSRMIKTSISIGRSRPILSCFPRKIGGSSACVICPIILIIRG
jgi:hypothetical protein